LSTHLVIFFFFFEKKSLRNKLSEDVELVF
jgi:hypothetical protein